MRLTGDRNQCQGCKAYFNSTAAFDKHRIGDFGKDRRCRTEDEMLARGMAKNKAGFWVGSPMLIAGSLCWPKTGSDGLGEAEVAT